MKTTLIFVGYETGEAEDLADLMPPILPAGNCKSEEARAASVASRTEDFKRLACNQPYTGALRRVCLIDPTHKVRNTLTSEGREPGNPTGSRPLAVAVRDWILKYNPDAWSDTMHGQRLSVPPAAFVGFEPKTFLKMLGLECARLNKPLPPAMWYSNSDHRDLTNALMPSDFKFLDWSTVLKAFRPTEALEQVPYDREFGSWPGPGKGAEKDAELAFWLAHKLGFVNSLKLAAAG
jgi:hypothetical protein